MRAIRPILIILVVLGVLFVAADRIAVHVADSRAADAFKDAQYVEGDPDVSIDGFPFLTQLVGGELDKVHVSARGMRAEGTTTTTGESLRIDKFSADLHHVELTGGFSRATADSITGTALISYKDLSDVAPDGVTVSYGGKSSKPGVSEVKVTGGISLLGRAFQRSVTSEIKLVDGDTVTLHANKIPAGGVPGLSEQIRKRVDFSQRVTGLPEGVKLDKVQAGPDGVTIELTGTGVSLNR